MDYFHVIQKTVKKRIQHLQQHPHQAHPIDRILSQFKKKRTTPTTTPLQLITPTTPNQQQIQHNLKLNAQFSTNGRELNDKQIQSRPKGKGLNSPRHHKIRGHLQHMSTRPKHQFSQD
jgi:hypothetical protein